MTHKIVRAVTVAGSVEFFQGMIPDFAAHGYEVVSVSSDGPQLENLRQMGVRTITVEMARHISPWQDIKSLWRLIKVFRREKPHMVHSMTPKAGLLCMMAAWITRVPVRLHTFTGLVFPTARGLKQKILILTDRLTCACATHIVPEGQGVKQDLIDFKITRKPLRVLGNGNVRGINLNVFDPELKEVKEAAVPLRKNGVFTFVFIGRIVKDKGINELVKAFKQLHRDFSATRLVLVGRMEQDLDPVSDETMSEIVDNPAIEAVGEQSDVRPWLAASDVFVFPSYREGFPNVVIEAGAMGLPSIVTDINGSREIINDKINGIIIQPRDSDALYDAMKKCMVCPEQLHEMSEQCRPMIAARYDYRYVRQCLIEYYAEILK